MATSIVSSSQPNDDGVRYERVDEFTVNMYIDGPGDLTVRPSHPSVLKMIERDREQIAELIARTQKEQEKLNARKSPEAS